MGGPCRAVRHAVRQREHRRYYERDLRRVGPARWLSRSEAFEQLIGACRDGTVLGLRDEALIRLGLAGMRAAEIIHLRVGDLRLHDAEPRIEWIGKTRQGRTIWIFRWLRATVPLGGEPSFRSG